MTLPRSVADVLADHVVFEIECIDRMYCNVYVPAAAVRRWAAGLHPAPARFADRLDRPAGEDHRRVQRGDAPLRPRPEVPWVDFAKGQRKDDVMHEHLARFDRAGGGVVHRPGAGEDLAVPHRAPPRRRRRLLSVDRARHRGGQPVLRLRRRRATSGRSSSSSAPTFPTTPSCASTATSGPNGRPPRPGSAITALDNGFATCDDPAAVQAICDRLGPSRSTRCCASGWRSCRTRSPPADREAGYRYDISVCRPSSP